MNQTSKKHHFVPQAQLRHFASDTRRRSLFVFDKQTGRSFGSSILDAGSENYFNTVSFGGEKWNFEDLFQDVDGRSARLVAEMVSRRSVTWLTSDDRIALADLFATQLLRTRFTRTTPKRIAEHLRELTRELGYDPDQDPDMALPSEAALRLGAVSAFLNRDGHAAALLRLHPALYVANSEHRFISSDHPVNVINAFAYGDRGLLSQGIVVLLPISPDLSLALHCPTIVNRYKMATRLDLAPEMRDRILHYERGLASGEPIAIDSDKVLSLNLEQVAHSARYLYSATNAFDFANEFLERHPELRSVDTHVAVGALGQVPPPRSSMPAETQLVIFGKVDHCMIAIAEIDEAGEGLTARTAQLDLLALVAADCGMLRAQLYIDGQVRREINEAMIERFGEPSQGWFRVVHRDPGLRALSARLDGKRAP
jgi:hypothetical protein